MGLDDFNISRSDRIASAAAVLLEAEAMGYRDKANLLGAMWQGWQDVMYIRLVTSLCCDRLTRQRHLSGQTPPGDGT